MGRYIMLETEITINRNGDPSDRVALPGRVVKVTVALGGRGDNRSEHDGGGNGKELEVMHLGERGRTGAMC